MRLYCVLFIVILHSPEIAARPYHIQSFTYHHNSHTPYIGQYVLQKLDAIVAWLNGRPEATVFDYIYRINRGAGLNLFEGDIKGRPFSKRTAIRKPEKLWNTRTIPYVVDNVFTNIEIDYINKAIEEFDKKTCVRFVPRTNENDYVHIVKNDGCTSHVGRFGGRQNLSLVAECLEKGAGIAIHEMMHVLGFFHEQNRPDRDYWVDIIWSNIHAGEEHNFDKLPQEYVDTLDVEYDYGSIMHYSSTAFSKNDLSKTILKKHMSLDTLGQREQLSGKDIIRVNKLYRCDIAGPLELSNLSTTPATLAPTPFHATTHQARPSTPQHHSATSVPGSVTLAPTPFITKVSPTSPSTVNLLSNTVSSLPTTGAPVEHLSWSKWSLWSLCDLHCKRRRHRFCFNNDERFCPGLSEEITDCPMSCKPAYRLGCWQYTVNSTLFPSVEMVYSTLSDPYKTRIGSLRKCADVAAEIGLTIFALADNGKCLTGSNFPKTFNAYGHSNNCSYNGQGSAGSLNAYTFTKDIDGGWGPWTEWGQCTKFCDGGLRYRYRSCDSPPPSGFGARCQGEDRSYETCNTERCQVEAKCGVKYYTGSAGTSGKINVGHYENFMQCDYEIVTGDPDQTISISVTRLDLEYSMSCIYDALMIFDGPNEHSSLIGAHCGSMPPPSFISSTNSIYLKFESDESNTGSGFTVSYAINSETRKSCAQPNVIGHGSMSNSSNFVGDSVIYTCDDGYNLIGSYNITCLDQPAYAVWSDDFPVCVKNIHIRSTGGDDNDMQQTCKFETDICGFTDHRDNAVHWTIRGADQSLYPQRPRTDSTYSESGHFLTAETTRFHTIGESSTTISNTYYPNGGSIQCLTFHSRLYGHDSSFLEISISSDFESDVPISLWRSGMSKYDTWNEQEIPFQSDMPYKIGFTYTVGDGYGSSAAIDNIIVNSGSC